MRSGVLHRHTPARDALLVGIGGCLGTLARVGLIALLPDAGPFPVPIFVINVTGAFALGWLLETLWRPTPESETSHSVRLFLRYRAARRIHDVQHVRRGR